MPWSRWLPFIAWFPMSKQQLTRDTIAGVAVAMVLVPQSMAYAALAGLPVVYGLYAATIPVAVAAMWGSSRFLHTGPVAMLSLLSAASVAPFAALGSERFVEISILLAFMVGALRLALGLFRMNVVMNFVSQPVIVGFTNAAALIIGLSLINTFIGVPRTTSDSFLLDLWRVAEQFTQAHWLTVIFGLATLALLMYGPRLSKSAPWVLLAVIIGTAASALVGFERQTNVSLAQIDDLEARVLLSEWRNDQARQKGIDNELSALPSGPLATPEEVARRTELLREQEILARELRELRYTIHSLKLATVDGETFRPAENGQTVWRPMAIQGETVRLSAGGAVVGQIPQGLPAIRAPRFDLDLMIALFPAAAVMALIGFMEATSISRALAARTREKVDGNQELIGQGLANIVGSFLQSYTVSGSFSRSAIAFRTGAMTGFFSIVSAAIVVVVMLLLTPYLYHLPQAVLAAIVMSAVFGLLNFKTLFDAWKVRKADAIAGFLTFFATLYLAPNLAGGVIAGVLLAVLLFLIGTVKPRSEIQGMSKDGVLAGISHGLEPISRRFIVLRFDASLVFMNAAHFEEALLDAVAQFPQAEALLVLGDSINRLDATGADKVRQMNEDLERAGVKLYFSGLKRPVKQAFAAAGLIDELGEDRFFSSKYEGVRWLKEHLDEQARESDDANTPGAAEPGQSAPRSA
ncbi:MAG: SulP family inorganic anion transporter [Thioalkalivibrionaceae bacterium]